MRRAYISISSRNVADHTDEDLLGRLAGGLPFPVEPSQRAAWQYEIRHVRSLAEELPDAHFFFEFLIPRMGRRADLVIVSGGLVFVVEYKLGATRFDRSALRQGHGYALDLKNFHETSHRLRLVPIVIATHAQSLVRQELRWAGDSVAAPIGLTPNELSQFVKSVSQEGQTQLVPHEWEAGRYRPTPTIVEAAQALYGGHDVEEISRSEAGAENLTVTADYVFGVIERAKTQSIKTVCFVTGVPGSGKTLAGLNLATARQRAHHEEHAVFLSGNGPLVEVLREALAIDAVGRALQRGERTTKGDEARRTSTFVQNIHHFRDEALRTDKAPVEKVAIFDEAQRAWDVRHTAK
ncbi:MAG: DNA/RNA helicase domain-containing protein, partial [Sphingomicrobium sp.]